MQSETATNQKLQPTRNHIAPNSCPALDQYQSLRYRGCWNWNLDVIPSAPAEREMDQPDIGSEEDMYP